MTDLSEEQRLYVTSIQQACHAINVIAGNVLGMFLVLVAITRFDILYRFQQTRPE